MQTDLQLHTRTDFAATKVHSSGTVLQKAQVVLECVSHSLIVPETASDIGVCCLTVQQCQRPPVISECVSHSLVMSETASDIGVCVSQSSSTRDPSYIGVCVSHSGSAIGVKLSYSERKYSFTRVRMASSKLNLTGDELS